MENKPTIILFGAGAGGITASEYLKHQYKLVAFADNDPKKHGQTLIGYPILSAKELRDTPIDKIVIASTYGLQIHRQLVYEENIDPTKIIRLPISFLKPVNPSYYFAALLVALFWVFLMPCILFLFFYRL